ncbi:hypothetical protein FAVG1_03586 [Fusarium avenaceum]|nr:hypothetical protein FAVG1_03586 [Fusarium avenaceum]
MSNPEKYTIGWVCALTTEFVAARALLDEKHDQPESSTCNDNNTYALGRIGKHNVMMAILPKSEYGMIAASTVARDILHSFPNIHLGLMVGIGGGAPSANHDIRLGDVIVSARGKGRGGVFQYNYVDKALEQRQHLRKKYSRPPPDSDKLYRSNFVHTDSSSECAKVCGNDPIHLVDRSTRSDQNGEPVIHYGLVASSNKVMKDALARDSLAASEDVLCFEMEAAGLMNHFPCIVIRGICDYSDSYKNKEWQGFAAMVAAAYAKDLLCQILPSKVAAEMPIRDALASTQLYHSGDKAKRSLDDLFTSHNAGKEQPDTTSLSAYVNTMIEAIGKVYIIINALDEYTERAKLIRCLKTLSSNKTQLIITRRPEVDFQREIPQLLNEQNYILLDKEVVNADIRSYVKATLEQRRDFVDKSLPPEILEIIYNKVRNGADGMFRWAACQLDSLARCLSPRDIKTTLNTLPQDLKETYRRILEGIPSEYKRDAIRLLQFLVHAKQPLKVSEAIEVIATQPDQNPPVFSINGRLCQEHDILHYCPSLVVIANVETYRGTVEELHLAHFSIKEYLLEQAQFDIHSASIIITKTCLTYLSDISGESITLEDNFPMAQFSADHWPSYAVLAEDSEEIVESIINFLQDEKSRNQWLSIYHHTSGPTWEFLGAPAPALYCACRFNLVATVRYLVAEGADINAQCGVDGSALQTASARGHLEIIQLLLKNGADTNVQYGTSASPLQYASAGGNLEAMRLLLKNGADTNVQYGISASPLQYASAGGNLEAMRLLLKNGADVNMASIIEDNALCAASRYGNIEAIRLLLENGADVNMTSREEDNALCLASRCGNIEAIRLLLDNGADVNMASEGEGNALCIACRDGKMEIVQLLLSQGANVNAHCGIYGSALEAARANEHSDIVQVLLHHVAIDDRKRKRSSSINVRKKAKSCRI